MNDATQEPVLLLIRGTLKDGANHEAARKTHNATAGHPEGVKAAKALGDLSHKVYVPATSALSGAKPAEFLILDVWERPEGIQKFFSDAQVQQGGGVLFAQRDPHVFMRARGARTFNLPAPIGRDERYVGVIRGKVKSPESAVATFAGSLEKTINAARQRGQLSHDLYFKHEAPAADGSAELLGVDLWTDLKGMEKHYQETMETIGKVFAGPPSASIWTQPSGEWVEW